jgi:hypothetical protein
MPKTSNFLLHRSSFYSENVLVSFESDNIEFKVVVSFEIEFTFFTLATNRNQSCVILEVVMIKVKKIIYDVTAMIDGR